MGKRELKGCVSEAKKPKVDPVWKNCKLVTDALIRSEIPVDVLTTLVEAVPFSLGVAQKNRHMFQHRMVEAIGRKLLRVEAGIETLVSEDAAAIDASVVKRRELEAASLEMQSNHTAIQSDYREKRHALATVARDFQAAKKAVADAESTRINGDNDLVATETKRMDIDVALKETIRPLKDGTIEKAEASKTALAIMGKLKKLMPLDESLVTTIPIVLAKEPQARGNFDNMVTNKLEDDISKCLQDLDRRIADAEAAKAKRTADVQVAATTYEDLKEQQTAVARAFTDIGKQLDDAKQGMENAARALDEMLLAESKATKQKEARQFDLGFFRDGALATFNELKNLSEELESAEAEAAMEISVPISVP